MKYRPVNVLPADWNRVKDFCRQAVLTYEPANAKIAAEMLSTVSLFVLWATREEHAPLDFASIFHPSLMGRYLRSRVSNKNSSAYKSLHSRLFRVANAVADVDHNRRKRGRYAVPVHEYTPTELADLESWAGAHHTAERRQQARTVLALMGGAGLWTKEALAVREADILAEADGYSVRVSGRNARVVPVLSDFASYFDTLESRSDGSRFVLFPDGSNEDSRAGSLKLLYRGAHPAPNPQWLRDTWMLRQLRALPATIVMTAAGMPDVSTLRRYLPNATQPYEEWTSALRNPAAYAAGMERTDDTTSAYADDTRRAADGKLRDEVAPTSAKLNDELVGAPARLAAASDSNGHAPLPGGRRRPRDRDHGKYARRPRTIPSHEEALIADSTAIPAGTPEVPFKRGEHPPTADSTAVPAGTPAAPFQRAASTKQRESDGALSAHEAGRERRREALGDNRSPKRPRQKSRYEALPPGNAQRAAPAEEPTATNAFDANDLMVAAIREGLLAEARRSARGGKR